MYLRKIYIKLGILFSVLCLTSCDNDGFDMENLPPDAIWANAEHNAFTDLAEYKGKVYCCFREAKSHLSYDGSIRVLESCDGEKWESIGVLSDPKYDFRDPKLIVTPDNRLMLTFGRRKENESVYPWNICKFITDYEITSKSLSIEGSQEMSINDDSYFSSYWIWRPKWIDGKCYGIAYKYGEFPILVVSEDGINYKQISVLHVRGNEADMERLQDGSFCIVIRADEGNGYIGFSRNLQEWIWVPLNQKIQCPCLINYNSQITVAGRGEIGTEIFKFSDAGLYSIYSIEGNADFAYPGYIVRKDRLWLSYYNTWKGRSTIFLKKIPIKELNL